VALVRVCFYHIKQQVKGVKMRKQNKDAFVFRRIVPLKGIKENYREMKCNGVK
jgi:hypothetical protein